MNNSRVALLVGAVSLAAVACAPVDNVVGELQRTSAGGGAEISNGVGGVAGDAGSTVGGTTTGGATTIAAGTASCDVYRLPKESHVVEVVVKNERDTPVYFPRFLGEESSCSTEPSLSLRDSNGADYPLTTSCSCNIVALLGGCPQVSCKSEVFIRLEAHSSVTLSWDGTYGTRTTIPAACIDKEGAVSQECGQRVKAPNGTYTLVVNGSTGWQCADSLPCGCEDDSCFNQELGPKMIRSGTLLEPSVTFDLLTTNSVTVSFTEGMENE